MLNQIIGKIFGIGNTQSFKSKDGNKTYQRRELILDTTRIDQYTGERTFESFAQFEFSGDKCAELDGFKVGDIVVVSFDLRATSYEKDGVNKWFSHVIGYKIEYRNTGSNSSPKPTTQSSQEVHEQNIPDNNQPNGSPQQPPFDDLPF